MLHSKHFIPLKVDKNVKNLKIILILFISVKEFGLNTVFLVPGRGRGGSQGANIAMKTMMKILPVKLSI